MIDQRDLRMIMDEDNWPRWPILPMKRDRQPGRDKELGVVLAGSTSKIYLVNMFEAKKIAGGTAEVKEYASSEELLLDGWVVDQKLNKKGGKYVRGI